MSIFIYQGQNQRMVNVKGEVEAPNTTIAKVNLQKQGILVENIRPKRTSSFKLGGKIKPAHISFVARQLSTMTSAGVPLVQSFSIMIEGLEHHKLKRCLNSVKSEIENGQSLAQSLAKQGQYFDALFCNLVEAGEQSGTLEEMLERIATYKEKTESLKKKIKKALFYPAAVVCVALIVTTVLLLFVVPQFEMMYGEFGAELPAFTRMVLLISNFVQHYWWLIFLAFIASIFLLRTLYKRSFKWRHFADRMILKTPIFGKILHLACVARFARTLSTTFAAGVPLVDALQSVSKAAGNLVYSDAISAIREDVTSGMQLQQAMRNTELFSNIVIQMVAIGEESGALEDMLAKVATTHEEDVDNSVDALSSLLEPLIMVVLGVLVGGLVVAMYLPVFQLGSVM